MGKISTTKGKTDAFADSNVGGSKFLPVGKHKNVRIVEALDVELGAKKSPALRLVLESESGAQMKTTIFYTQHVWVKGQMTDETELSWKLRALTGALVKDEALRSDVFSMCYDQTSLFERLVGFRVDIEVAYPKKGLAILRDSDAEEIGIYDLGNESELVKTFESFTDAVDYIKEEGLNRAYTDVMGYSRTVTEDGTDINAKSIQAFIKAGVKSSSNKGSVSPLGKRTAGTSI